MLQGADSIIKIHKPLILSEFGPEALEQVSHMNPEMFIDALAQHGYATFILNDAGQLKPCANARAVMLYLETLGRDHINLVFEHRDRQYLSPWIHEYGHTSNTSC